MLNRSTILTIAGAAVLAAGIATLVAGPKPVKESPPPAAGIAPLPQPVSRSAESADGPVEEAAPLELAPPEMIEAKTALAAEYAERRKTLPEEVAKPIDDDIGMIEGIAADLLAALASEPENENLKRMLVQTYRNEVKLLRKALHLSSEDDEGLVEPESDGDTAPAN